MFMKKVKSLFKKEKKLIISLSILMLGNGILYWFIKLFQRNPIYINYYLDDKIPYWGWLVYVYNMFYPFCVIAFCFLYKGDEKTYFKALISCIIGVIICDTIYLFVPTIMYRPITPNYDAFTNLVLRITYFFDDPPLNCFPSLHCLFCFQVIFSFIKSKCTYKTKIWMIICKHRRDKYFISFIYDIIAAFLVCLIANMSENIFAIYNKLKKKKII